MTDLAPRPDGEGRDVSSGVTQSSRRRFVAGALTAPAMFTLPAGASATAFGSFGGCMRQNNVKPPELLTMYSDQYARTPVRAAYFEPIGRRRSGVMKMAAEYDGQWYTSDYVELVPRRRSFVDRYGNRYRMRDDEVECLTPWILDMSGGRPEVMGVNPVYFKHGGSAVYTSCYISIIGV